MNEDVRLYTWVRSGASIFVGHIAALRTEPSPTGEEIAHFQIQVDEVLWGADASRLHEYDLRRPVSQYARLKFPDPIWGRVDLRQGVSVFVVQDGSPVYVDHVPDRDDPVIVSVRSVLKAEAAARSNSERYTGYMKWLAEGNTVEKLFGAEALATGDLPDVDPKGTVAAAFASAFEHAQNLYVKLSIAEWMWKPLYSRTNEGGQVAIAHAAVRGLEDPSGDVRGLCLDKLIEADLPLKTRAGEVATPEAIAILKKALADADVPETRERIRTLLDSLIGRK